MRNAVERRLAVGVFDGVHIGHRAILEGADAALTFSRHPLSVVDPAAAPRLISPLDERIALIRACGVRDVLALDFTEKTAAMTADEFAAEYLGVGSGGGICVRCGGNWRFGRGGEGSAQWLRSRGVDVEVVPYAMYRGEAVSSSRIRRELALGGISAVNDMLGRRYSLTGFLREGKGRGRQLGYPTLNLEVDSFLRCGVYEAEVRGVRAIANYGKAPTMGEDAWTNPVLEVHLLGGESSVSTDGGRLTVEFLRFIRPERKFSSEADLLGQIPADVGNVLSSSAAKGDVI